jgi:signal transduction histidine kinase
VDSTFSLFDPPPDATADEVRSRLTSLKVLIERAPIPIAIAHDPDCHYISGNEAMVRLLGLPPDANISMDPPKGQEPFYRIQRNGEDIPTADLPMQFAIANRTHVRNDIEIVRRDGTVLYVQNDVEPLYDRAGNVIGCVSVVVDYTARKYVEDVLREADQRKDQFLATLSHELRNPLAPIRHALELMRRAPTDMALMERARVVMERQLAQLVRLTDDLLDVSRITHNRIELRRDRIDVRDALASAIETTQPLIEAAGHKLDVTLPPEPGWVYADLTRLSQAFANLLNNAAKYTDRGGVIGVRATMGRDIITVVVTDTGIGIPADLLPRIFDMFMQADFKAERARGGLGIGLSLAKQLIELHGGSIDVQSGPAGTTFMIRLPLATERRQSERGPAQARGPVRPHRVLVAEDIPDAAEMLRLMLEAMGHTVRVAGDGIHALAIAKEFEPEVALIDLGMPRMDGFEAARQIRAALDNRVVMIALSGWGQDEDKQRARDAGFDHHLTKPADPDVLDKLIASAGD